MGRPEGLKFVVDGPAACEACGRDLSASTNSEDYCIALVNVAVPSCGGPVTDMAATPVLEREIHFCGLACLNKWVLKPGSNDNRRVFEAMSEQMHDSHLIGPEPPKSVAQDAPRIDPTTSDVSEHHGE